MPIREFAMRFMKFSIFVLALSASVVGATDDGVRLECIVSNPCKYSYLNCVTQVDITGDSKGAEEVVHIQEGRVSRMEKNIVQLEISERAIKFTDETGDEWGVLKLSGSGIYSGKITYAQDFEFSVRCLDKTIGLE
jgi:hypothetical protein